MRVPDSLNRANISANLASLATRNATLTREASSGIRVTTPSSDPRAASELTKLVHTLERTSAFKTNITYVRSDLELSEGVLAESSTLFERVRELAVQAANGTMGAVDRDRMADEVLGLKEHLLGLANAKGSNGHLFAGSATETQPFDGSGNFGGNSDEHPVEVGPGQVMDVSIDGARAFGVASGQNAFAIMNALEAALRSNDQDGVIATLDGIDAAHKQIVQARADAGAKLNRLDISQSALDQSELLLSEQKAHLGEADLADTYSKLIRVQNSIEQAIAVARRTLNVQRFEP